MFALLNSEDKIWINIFKSKYSGGWHLWNPDKISKSSLFYKSICNTAKNLRPNIKLLACNPELVDIWNDACFFDLPISRKPTYLNTSLNLEDLQFSDLFSSNGFCSQAIASLFGTSFDMALINDIHYRNEDVVIWKWNNLSCKPTIASSVYSYLNSQHHLLDCWRGWNEIWKLPVLPHIKIHLWKLAHGKLPTNAYLYNLNIGPNNPCPLCRLEDETAEHAIWHCSKILQCWHDVSNNLGLPSCLSNSLSTGSWLVGILDPWAKAIIATVTWLIWKQRFNTIFRNDPVNSSMIVTRAWSLCYDFRKSSHRDRALLCANINTIHIFTDASWSPCSLFVGLDFLILTNSNCILAAGLKGTSASSQIQAEIAAINLALRTCIDKSWTPARIFYDCPGVAQLLKHYNPSVTWHVSTEFQTMKKNLDIFPNITIETISRELNFFADTLANLGRSNPQLSLFFIGMERPF